MDLALGSLERVRPGAITVAHKPAALPFEVVSVFESKTSASEPKRLWFSRRFSLVVSRAVLSLAVLILLAAVGLYAFRASYEDKVYPSIYVMGSDFGGMTYPEAKDALQASAATLLDSQMTFTYEGRRWSPTYAEIGVQLDATATLNTLFDIGREPDARNRVSSTLDIVSGKRAIPLTLSIDETTFNAWIDSIDADLGTPGRDAYLVIEDGKVSVEPDVDGIAVDRSRLHTLVVEGLGANQAFAGELPTTADPASVHVADLESARLKLESALDTSIKLAYGKERWKLTPSDLGQFVVQTSAPGHVGAAAVVSRLIATVWPITSQRCCATK
jgi:hypothetical protein